MNITAKMKVGKMEVGQMVYNVYTGAYGPIKKVYIDETGTTRYDVEFDSELGPPKNTRKSNSPRLEGV